jgi:acetyl-CoA acetyltransferase
MVHDPLTKLQCCPTSDGSAAAVIVSQKFMERFALKKDKAVEVLGIEMRTDTPSSFNSKSMRRAVSSKINKVPRYLLLRISLLDFTYVYLTSLMFT